MAPVIEKVDMTGSEVSYKIPADTLFVSFHAKGGKIDMGTVSGGDVFEIPKDRSVTWQSSDCPNHTSFFTGNPNVDLQIFRETGVGT